MASDSVGIVGSDELDLWAGGLVIEVTGPRSHGPVEVAVDAPGASHTYTYAVPERLAGIEPGEAVLVEFGRGRQALGVVVGEADRDLAVDAQPILARVRADGPLLPPLSLAFALWISSEYLAPPAAVLRSMLPPGMLERLELVAEWQPTQSQEMAGQVAGAAPVAGAALGGCGRWPREGWCDWNGR